MNEYKISSRQFTILIATFLIGSAALYGASFMATAAKQDSWIVYLTSLVFSVFLVFLYSSLSNMYPQMTFVEINQKVFGKWIGTFTALCFLFTFFVLSCAMAQSISVFIVTLILPESSLPAVVILFMLVSVLGVYYGIEVIVRFLEIFFPWIFIFLFIIVFSLISQMDFKNLEPVLENGWKPIFGGTFQFVGFTYLELVVFLSIIPSVNHPKIKRCLLKGILTAWVCIFTLMIACLLVLGPYITSTSVYATYILGKKISLGEFFERIEVVVGTLWTISVFIKMEVSLFVFTDEFARVLKLKDYKTVLIPIGYLITFFSIFFWPNVFSYRNWEIYTWTPLIFIIGLILPLTLLTIGNIRKRLAKSEGL